MVIHRPNDAFLPGAPPRATIGRGVQLYVRTVRHAYTAFFHTFRGACASCPPGYRLLDETLFDHRTDAGEARNLAYMPAHEATRREMLDVVVREWNVTALVGPNPLTTLPNRSARVEYLQLAGAGDRARYRGLAKGGGGKGGGGKGGGGKAKGGGGKAKGIKAKGGKTKGGKAKGGGGKGNGGKGGGGKGGSKGGTSKAKGGGKGRGRRADRARGRRS